MRILIFDTETSGLDAGLHVMLQLSYQIVESANFFTIKSVNHYFPWPWNPFRVSEEAIAVNGLTAEWLSQQRLSSRKSALQEFVADMATCGLVVAHNLQFDQGFLIAACMEEGVAIGEWPDAYCTMVETTDFCGIPSDGFDDYKWPKLTELAQCLGVDYDDIDLHDSMADVELTKRCFQALLRCGAYRFPETERIRISLQSDAAGGVRFIVLDAKGNEMHPSCIPHLMPKTQWQAICNRLLVKWKAKKNGGE
ncbi:MAG: 3'-5' exonuclease [Bacteroidales bacterium]|nr:3'-5' exonuclease [Bacteroidales bacterium]